MNSRVDGSDFGMELLSKKTKKKASLRANLRVANDQQRRNEIWGPEDQVEGDSKGEKDDLQMKNNNKILCNYRKQPERRERSGPRALHVDERLGRRPRRVRRRAGSRLHQLQPGPGLRLRRRPETKKETPEDAHREKRETKQTPTHSASPRKTISRPARRRRR